MHPSGCVVLYPDGRGADIEQILVINPNSSESITAQIRDAVADRDGVCVITSQEGPPAIESDADVVAAVEPMLETARHQDAAAVVVACFSDPGLDELRAESTVPAFGIAESAVRRALQVGDSVGVISSVEDSLPRHERYWAKLGVQDRIVADISLGLGVLELDTEEAVNRARQAGHELVAAGADVVVLGCTGMTHMQGRLEDSLGVPVVDPCLAAVQDARDSLAGELE
jgi:Asp/Glu/hydantoin racemase